MNVGTFQIKIKATSPNDLSFKNAIELDAWVDSGSTFTQIPSSILKQFRISPLRIEEFELANGSFIKCEIGTALLFVEGKPTIDEVTFGPEGNNNVLLGATTLEHTGLLIDPQNQKLVKRPGGIVQFSLI